VYFPPERKGKLESWRTWAFSVPRAHAGPNVGLIPSKRSTKIKEGLIPCQPEFHISMIHRPNSGQRGPHFYGEAERKPNLLFFLTDEGERRKY
jgi:hypothetical protein